ncbi:MAG TPA: hypothetical protein VF302_10405 [Candidatus Limnocylindrales bacterium]
MSPYQLPPDCVPPACPCEACAALAIALDADIRARLAVLTAARRVDAVHRLAGKPPREEVRNGI